MDNIRWNVLERDGKVYLQLFAASEQTLDQCPVGHNAIARDGVEVEIVVKIIRAPLDLEDDIPMLTFPCLGLMAGSLTFALQIVYANVTITETNADHVRMLRVDVKAGHP